MIIIYMTQKTNYTLTWEDDWNIGSWRERKKTTPTTALSELEKQTLRKEKLTLLCVWVWDSINNKWATKQGGWHQTNSNVVVLLILIFSFLCVFVSTQVENVLCSSKIPTHYSTRQMHTHTNKQQIPPPTTTTEWRKSVINIKYSLQNFCVIIWKRAQNKIVSFSVHISVQPYAHTNTHKHIHRQISWNLYTYNTVLFVKKC